MKTMLGLIGGAVIGAGAALLFAPQSGRATRSMLRDKATKYGHDVSDFVGSKSRHLQNKMQGISHNADEMMARGEQLINEGREKVDELADHAGELLRHGHDALDKAKSSMDVASSESTTA